MSTIHQVSVKIKRMSAHLEDSTEEEKQIQKENTTTRMTAWTWSRGSSLIGSGDCIAAQPLPHFQWLGPLTPPHHPSHPQITRLPCGWTNIRTPCGSSRSFVAEVVQPRSLSTMTAISEMKNAMFDVIASDKVHASH